MTPVGHTLAGLTIAVLAMPQGESHKRRLATLGVFSVLANVPDLPFPGWGHDRYDISHSVFVIGLLLVVALLIFLLNRRFTCRAGGKKILLCGAAACLSHLLLDTFYNHGNGLAMFWPLSDASLALPVPWFETLKTSLPKMTFHSLRVFAIEFACYGPILVAAILWRRRRSDSRNE